MLDENNVVDTKEEVDIEQNVDLFENRRRMAYICLISILLFATILIITLFLKPTILDNFNKIEDVVSTVIYGLFGIVFAYYGVTSFADFIASKGKK